MDKRVKKKEIIRWVWVVFEYSTGKMLIFRRKVDLIKYLDSNINTFNYRWGKSRVNIFWENRYIISRQILR